MSDKTAAVRTLRRVFTAKRVVRLVMYVFLLDLMFVFLYPFLYMLITSIKSPEDVMDVTVNWLVNQVYVHNYALSWEALQYPVTLLRTVFLVVVCTLGHLIACSLVGYGFARFEFRGKGVLFIFLLLAIIVPPQTIVTPLYMIYAGIGITNTMLPLILPTWLGLGLKGGLFIFLFRQFYLSLPRSLEEAANIDGCGFFSTYFRIAMPASRSSVMVCLVLSLVWHWNDYFEPTLFIHPDKKLLPMMLPGIYTIMNGGGSRDMSGAGGLGDVYTEAVGMAATVLVVLPVFLAYMFLQKQFIQGVERSGITGE